MSGVLGSPLGVELSVEKVLPAADSESTDRLRVGGWNGHPTLKNRTTDA